MAEWTLIPEILDPAHPEHRLGRHIHRPADFYQRKALEGVAGPTVWKRHVGPFNQGELGSCTGNASAGALMTDPFFATIPTSGPYAGPYGEPNAVTFYSQATHYNGDESYYPPNDTGSSGPAVAEALEKDGLISNYGHTTDLQSSLNALAIAPGIFGISWMTSFDTPLPTGECALTAGATVRGGHEIQSYENDPENQRIWFWQSWGAAWGGLGNGTFWLSYQTMTSLFGEGADGTFFVPATSTPTPPASNGTSNHEPWWKRVFHF